MTTEQIEGPRFATEDDFPAVLDLMDRCFHHRSGGMGDEWAHCYDPNSPEEHVIIKKDGDVVSNVGCIEQRCLLESSEISVGGITAVGTDQRYRGNGFMTAILEFWLDELDNREVPLSDLAGDRQRYGRFGWDNGGHDRYYRISDRSLLDKPEKDAFVSVYDGSDSAIDFVQTLYQSLNYRVKRNREMFSRHFGRSNLLTLLYTEPGEESYLTFKRNQERATVTEVVGTENGVRALLSYIFRVYGAGLQSLQVRIPTRHPLNDFFAQWNVSSGWRTVPHRKLNIRNLALLLEAFEQQISDKWLKDGHGTQTVSLAIQDGTSAVELASNDAGVSVSRIQEPAEIELNRRQMTRLLFGYPDTVSDYDGNVLLDTILPLEFYIPRTDQV